MTDSRCPGMTMFEVNAVAGISTAPFLAMEEMGNKLIVSENPT